MLKTVESWARQHLKLMMLLAAAVVGVVALAAGEVVDRTGSSRPVYFERGIYIGGPAGGIYDPTVETRNKISQAKKSAATPYDFPALVANTCVQTGSITVTGAAFGDTCIVGIDQAPVNPSQLFTAHVSAANTAIVKDCYIGANDGGSVDMPDASYTVRCFR